jgi:hypothetical protein
MFDGTTDGEKVGMVEGKAVGPEGTHVGGLVRTVGSMEGIIVGILGIIVGNIVGARLGIEDGELVG